MESNYTKCSENTLNGNAFVTAVVRLSGVVQSGLCTWISDMNVKLCVHKVHSLFIIRHAQTEGVYLYTEIFAQPNKQSRLERGVVVLRNLWLKCHWTYCGLIASRVSSLRNRETFNVGPSKHPNDIVLRHFISITHDLVSNYVKWITKWFSMKSSQQFQDYKLSWIQEGSEKL